MKWLLTVLALAFALLVPVTGYTRSGWLYVHVHGTQKGLTFRLSDANGDSLTKNEPVIRLTVQKHTGGGWQIVWQTHGSSAISFIEYAAAPTGMTTDVDAMPLSTRSIYRVAVTALPSSGPFLYGIAYFRFDKLGNALSASPIP